MKVQKACCQGVKCWQTDPFRLFLRRLVNTSCLSIWLWIKHMDRIFFFFLPSMQRNILQQFAQFRLPSVQLYWVWVIIEFTLCIHVSYWAVILFVTTGYNLGISSPKSEEPHYVRKVRVKPILWCWEKKKVTRNLGEML